MKELAAVLIAFALLAGASWLAIEKGGDRELMVSPPDAVAEGFTREVLTKRWDRAKTYLAEPDSVTDEQLEALKERLGEGTNVESEVVWHHESRAEANVSVEDTGFNVPLIWQHREWKIARLP